MIKYILRRTFFSIWVILGVLLLTFALFNIAAGDPAGAVLGKNAKTAEIEALRRELGSDLPLFYGKLCRTIAHNLLGNAEDVEECENDVYLALWNAIPPARPRSLSAYLGRITRNLAVNRFHARGAQKRGGNGTSHQAAAGDSERCGRRCH